MDIAHCYALDIAHYYALDTAHYYALDIAHCYAFQPIQTESTGPADRNGVPVQQTITLYYDLRIMVSHIKTSGCWETLGDSEIT